MAVSPTSHFFNPNRMDVDKNTPTSFFNSVNGDVKGGKKRTWEEMGGVSEQVESEGERGASALPLELLIRIFENLPSKYVAESRLVCSNWRIAGNDVLKRRLVPISLGSLCIIEGWGTEKIGSGKLSHIVNALKKNPIELPVEVFVQIKTHGLLVIGDIFDRNLWGSIVKIRADGNFLYYVLKYLKNPPYPMQEGKIRQIYTSLARSIAPFADKLAFKALKEVITPLVAQGITYEMQRPHKGKNLYQDFIEGLSEWINDLNDWEEASQDPNEDVGEAPEPPIDFDPQLLLLICKMKVPFNACVKEKATIFSFVFEEMGKNSDKLDRKIFFECLQALLDEPEGLDLRMGRGMDSRSRNGVGLLSDWMVGFEQTKEEVLTYFKFESEVGVFRLASLQQIADLQTHLLGILEDSDKEAPLSVIEAANITKGLNQGVNFREGLKSSLPFFGVVLSREYGRLMEMSQEELSKESPEQLASWLILVHFFKTYPPSYGQSQWPQAFPEKYWVFLLKWKGVFSFSQMIQCLEFIPRRSERGEIISAWADELVAHLAGKELVSSQEMYLLVSLIQSNNDPKLFSAIASQVTRPNREFTPSESKWCLDLLAEFTRLNTWYEVFGSLKISDFISAAKSFIGAKENRRRRFYYKRLIHEPYDPLLPTRSLDILMLFKKLRFLVWEGDSSLVSITRRHLQRLNDTILRDRSFKNKVDFIFENLGVSDEEIRREYPQIASIRESVV